MTTLWDSALQELKRQFSVDLGVIHLLNPKKNQLYLIAYSKGLSDKFLDGIREIAVGKGISGNVALTKKPIATHNLIEDAPPSAIPIARTIGVRGMVCVPIFDNQGAVAGTLGLGCYKERTFSEQEINDIIEAAKKLAAKLTMEPTL